MSEIIIGILSSIIAAVIIMIVRIVVQHFKKSSKRITLIDKIILESTPFFKDGLIVNLEKVNYIYGANSTGKTALSEWISVLEDDKNVNRWLTIEKTMPILFSVNIQNSLFSNIHITIESYGVSYFTAEKKHVLSPINYRFVFLADKQINFRGMNSITYLSQQLNITETQLVQLIENFNLTITISVQAIKIGLIDSEKSVLVKLHKGRDFTSFFNLSISEQQRVMIELGIHYCNYLSKICSTFLVIEKNTFCIDDEYYIPLIDKLSDDLFAAQSLIISVDAPLEEFNQSLKRLVFTGEVPNIEILEL